MSRPALLAIDCGTCTGWCAGIPGDTPVYGSFRLPSQSGHGVFFDAFETAISDLIAVHDPRLIVYEAPLIVGAKTSVQTAFRLMTIAGIVEKLAHQRGQIRCEPANNQQVKKAIVGFGGAKKGDTMEAMFRRGFRPENDNIGDAIAIFLFAELKHAPHVRRAAGPLFA